MYPASKRTAKKLCSQCRSAARVPSDPMVPIRPAEKMYMFREIDVPNAQMYCNIMLIRDLKNTFIASFTFFLLCKADM